MARDLSPPDLLFLDIETSGLFLEKLSIDDPAQPWACSIAAALCNRAGVMTNFFHHLVKAEGRTIKENAEKVHGISARATAQVGIPEARVLGCLTDMLKTAPMDSHMKVITFGDFDARIVSSLLARFAVSQNKPSSAYDRLWLRRPLTEFINIMTPFAQQLCKIPSAVDFSTEYKWPTLDEAAQIILGREPRVGHHDAFNDMLILRDLYFHMVERGFFEQGVAAA